MAFGGAGNERLSLWSYNDRNDLTGSDRREGDNPGSPGDPVDDEQFAYAYDPIGNRTEYDVGVQDPSNTDYEPNQLNQYLRAVTDDPNVAQGYRHDEDGNLIEAFVAADMNCDGAIDSFDVDPFILAMTNPTLYEQTYPNCNILNGDLNGDGAVDSFDLDLFTALLLGSGGASGLRVEYTWNAENRLTAVTPVSPQVDDIKVEFAYDYMGRRIEKKVYDWTGSAWSQNPTMIRRFVWSGWLLLMELDGNDDPVRKYTWGLDLSQTLSGAGGIGGLLAVHDESEDEDYVYTYDANGNVGQLVAWASGFGGATGDEWHADRLVAHYEYDPYGNIVNDISGYAYAEENPFRFSTKYWDDETGLGYWGYRYYSPRTGRWLSRDPIGDLGGLLLYGYVANNPTGLVDPYGLWFTPDTIWDIVSVIWDAGKITVGIVTDNPKLVADGLIDLTCDSVALLIPGVPAGATKLARLTGKGAAKAAGSLANGTELVFKVRKMRRVETYTNTSVIRGMELPESVGIRRVFSEDNFHTNILFRAKCGGKTIASAELDFAGHTRKVLEFKNIPTLGGSQAALISTQVRHQRKVLARFESISGCNLNHAGVVVSDFTSVTNTGRGILHRSGIDILRPADARVIIEDSWSAGGRLFLP